MSNKMIDDFLSLNKIDHQTYLKFKHVFDYYASLKLNDKLVPKLIYENGVVDIVFSMANNNHPNAKNLIINHMPTLNYHLDFSKVYARENTDLVMQNFIARNIFPIFDSPTNGFMLSGPIGCGKTYLMSAVANKFLELNKTVAFVKMSQLVNDIKKSFIFSDDPILYDLLNKCKKVNILFIDDLGAEAISEWSRDEILFSILDYRMENNLLTCFTTNLSKELLYETYLCLKKEDENKVNRLLERIEVLSKYVVWPKNNGSLRLKP